MRDSSSNPLPPGTFHLLGGNRRPKEGAGRKRGRRIHDVPKGSGQLRTSPRAEIGIGSAVNRFTKAVYMTAVKWGRNCCGACTFVTTSGGRTVTRGALAVVVVE